AWHRWRRVARTSGSSRDQAKPEHSQHAPDRPERVDPGRLHEYSPPVVTTFLRCNRSRGRLPGTSQCPTSARTRLTAATMTPGASSGILCPELPATTYSALVLNPSKCSWS